MVALSPVVRGGLPVALLDYQFETFPPRGSFGQKRVSAAHIPSATPAVGASWPHHGHSKVRTAKDEEDATMEHLPLVRTIARRIQQHLPRHVEFADLVSAGTIGLLDAIRRFDSECHNEFRTYAQFRIKGAMLDHLRSTDWGSRALRQKARAVSKASDLLRARYGMDPSDCEIATEMALSLADYQRLIGDLHNLELSYFDWTEENTGQPAGPENIAGEGDDAFALCVQEQQSRRLRTKMELLPENHRRVLELYYFEECTMKEIGRRLGVVESRVSQIRTTAIAKLRELLEA